MNNVAVSKRNEEEAPPLIPEKTIANCIEALLKWKNQNSDSEKLQLLEEDEFLYLVLSLKNTPPKSHLRPKKIPLPHPIHSPAFSDACLFIDDRAKSKLTSESVKNKVKSEEITISKVISFSKIKSNYREYEKRRKLCNSYDLFFADKRLTGILPKYLGKHFFSGRRIPIPVDLMNGDWKKHIERVCSSALLYLRMGTCSVLRVGRLSMEGEEMLENVVASINGITEIVPNNWSGIRSLHLKLSGSPALPLYQTLPDVRLKIEGLKNPTSIDDQGDGRKKKIKTVKPSPSALKRPRLLDMMIIS